MSSSFRKVLPILFIFLMLFSAFGYFYSRGFMLHDEGYILHAGQRILDGEIPYKDFDIVYTPGSAYVTAFFFKIFGEKIIVARLGSLVFVLGSIVILYKLFSLFSKQVITVFIPIAVYISWIPIHLNFSWPVVYASFFAVGTCYFLVIGRKEKKQKYYFLAGISTVAAVLFKQNFGLATCVSVLIFFMLDQNTWKTRFISSYLAGSGISAFLFIFYLLSTSSFYPFISDSYYYLIQKISIEKVVNTTFVYQDKLINMLLRTAFYLIPFIASLIGIVVAFRHKKELVFIHALVLFFYVFGIRPVTDFVHLIPLLAISGLSLGALLICVKKQLLKLYIYLFSFFLISIGIYTALFKGYYRWESAIIYHNTYLNDRIGVFVDEKYSNQVKDLKSYVSKKTNTNEYIYVNYYYPSLYFILDRKNPTRFIYLSSHVVDTYEGEIIKSLIEKKVKLVITDPVFNDNKSKIFRFIQDNYSKKENIRNFAVWTR